MPPAPMAGTVLTHPAQRQAPACEKVTKFLFDETRQALPAAHAGGQRANRLEGVAGPHPQALAVGHGTPPAARICFSSSAQLTTTRSLPPFEPRRIMMKRPSGVTS